ncbi:MAG: tetratricopeptide repeat protein [Saprospiraceae bacterium]
MIGISPKFGINGDERFQVDYSKKLWSYYTSFGKETSALYVPEGNMHLYGGLFEILAISIQKALDLNDEFDPAFHIVRRILCAIFGFITIYFASLMAKNMGGWQAAFLTAVMLILSPRFFGDTMVNPKDIPFAAGFSIGLFSIANFIRTLPNPSISTMTGVIAGSVISIGTRAGGLLLILFLIFFVILFLGGSFISDTRLRSDQVWKCIRYTTVTCVLSYFGGLLFWPFGLVNPMTNPIYALNEFSNQPIALSILFKSQHLLNTQLPLNYLPEWIIRTLPIAVILGIFLFIRQYQDKSIPRLESSILAFFILFSIGFTLIRHSSLHDGWRHFIFVYPAMVILAAIGWLVLFRNNQFHLINKIGSGLLVLLLLENIYSIIHLHPYQYTYFNPLFGGLRKAYGKFETDYWMLSVKEACDWIKQEEETHPKDSTITIATNCFYPSRVFMSDTSLDNKIAYVRYYDRGEKLWDYGIFYSRFVDQYQLAHNIWPPEGTVHTIDADGIPLCAIVKRANIDDYLGYEAVTKKNLAEAIRHFTKALEYDPFNEKAAMALSIVYLSVGQPDLAEKSLNQSLNSFPNNPGAEEVMNSIQAWKKKLNNK